MIAAVGVYIFCMVEWKKTKGQAFKSTTDDNFWGRSLG
jgi:hypothetical protein